MENDGLRKDRVLSSINNLDRQWLEDACTSQRLGISAITSMSAERFADSLAAHQRRLRTYELALTVVVKRLNGG